MVPHLHLQRSPASATEQGSVDRWQGDLGGKPWGSHLSWPGVETWAASAVTFFAPGSASLTLQVQAVPKLSTLATLKEVINNLQHSPARVLQWSIPETHTHRWVCVFILPSDDPRDWSTTTVDQLSLDSSLQCLTDQ